MRYVLLALIYVMIGIGVTAAATERSGKPVAEKDVVMVILIWPSTVAGKAYMMWTEPKDSCTRALGGQM